MSDETPEIKEKKLSELLDEEINSACGENKRYPSRQAWFRIAAATADASGVPFIVPETLDKKGLSPQQAALLDVLLDPSQESFTAFKKKAAEKHPAAATDTTLPSASKMKDIVHNCLVRERRSPEDVITYELPLLAKHHGLLKGIGRVPPLRLQMTLLGCCGPQSQQAIVRKYITMCGTHNPEGEEKSLGTDTVRVIIRDDPHFWDTLRMEGRTDSSLIEGHATRVSEEETILKDAENMSPKELLGWVSAYVSLNTMQTILATLPDRKGSKHENDMKDLLLPIWKEFVMTPDLGTLPQQERDALAFTALGQTLGNIDMPTGNISIPPPLRPFHPNPLPIKKMVARTASLLDTASSYDVDVTRETSWRLLQNLLHREPDREKRRKIVRSIFGTNETSSRIIDCMDDTKAFPDNIVFAKRPQWADQLIKECNVPESLQAKTARCLLGIPFKPEKGNVMTQVLHYAESHPEFTAANAFFIARMINRWNEEMEDIIKDSGAKKVRAHINTARYTSQHTAEFTSPHARDIEALGRTMGCETETDFLLWRQLVTHRELDKDHHQDKINAYMDGASKSGAANRRKTQSEFFACLGEAYGLVFPEDIAAHIAGQKETWKHKEKDLCHAIRQAYKGPLSNRAPLTEKKSAPRAAAAGNTGITLPQEASQIIAEFAFPGDEKRQRHCRELLAGKSRQQETSAEASQRVPASASIKPATMPRGRTPTGAESSPTHGHRPRHR